LHGVVLEIFLAGTYHLPIEMTYRGLVVPKTKGAIQKWLICFCRADMGDVENQEQNGE
jgi:hypothetical protein